MGIVLIPNVFVMSFLVVAVVIFHGPSCILDGLSDLAFIGSSLTVVKGLGQSEFWFKQS
jgi:hypothetical protein